MTVESQDNRTRLTADGVLTDFDFTFKIFTNTQILVYLIDTDGNATLQTLTTHYTVSINTTSEGGTVSFVTAPTDQYEVLMIRNIAYEQSADIPVNEGFSEEVIENALDRLCMQIQQLKDEVDRSPTMETASTYSDLTIPDPESEKLLRWKSDLSGLENILLTDVSTIEADITIAGGDAHKIVKVKSDETGYELESFETAMQRDTDLQVGGIFKWKKGADVASAAALTLGDDGNYFDITGTTDITSITAKTAGTMVMLQFDGALTLTDGSNILLANNEDFDTAAGHTIILICDGTNWIELARSPKVPLKVFVGSFTRDQAAASEDVAYTGVGFQPKAVIFFGVQGGSDEVGLGFDDGTSSKGHYVNGTTGIWDNSTGKALIVQESTGNNQEALIASFDSDGFTLTWTKNGTPTGTITVMYLAFA